MCGCFSSGAWGSRVMVGGRHIWKVVPLYRHHHGKAWGERVHTARRHSHHVRLKVLSICLMTWHLRDELMMSRRYVRRHHRDSLRSRKVGLLSHPGTNMARLLRISMLRSVPIDLLQVVGTLRHRTMSLGLFRPRHRGWRHRGGAGFVGYLRSLSSFRRRR